MKKNSRAPIQLALMIGLIALVLMSGATNVAASPRAQEFSAQFIAAPPLQSAGMSVNYNPPTCTGNVQPWPDEAKAAFDFSVQIWQSALVLAQPVVVDACWKQLDSDTLGTGGPTTSLSDFEGALATNVAYPVGLANQIAGKDLNGADSEISTEFNSATNYHFGTDGKPPSGKLDFVSVVLHELAHGLGAGIDSLEAKDGNGSWGDNGVPSIFDRFVVNGKGQLLIDTTAFPNPSVELAQQINGGSVFFNGKNAVAVNGDKPVRLYSPSQYVKGSSVSHLDQETYQRSPNGLFTSDQGDAEATHNLGPILLGMLRDLGWTTR